MSCKRSATDYDFSLDTTKEKNMKLSKTCRTALIAIAGFLLTAAFHMGRVAHANSPQGVRNVVIVHGAWADGSSWSKVIPLLQAKGVHVVALAPSDGESVASITKSFPPAPLGSEVRADAEGFLTVTPKGIAEDLAQDLSDSEKQLLTATQGPTAAAVFGATVTTAAWKTKPSWFVIASNDRAVSPEFEKTEAEAMKATSITVPSSHVPMLSHPKEVADLIEQAAAKAGSLTNG
jgi:pimeloyl-ACP methyl ester carboxylesterase